MTHIFVTISTLKCLLIMHIETVLGKEQHRATMPVCHTIFMVSPKLTLHHSISVGVGREAGLSPKTSKNPESESSNISRL